MSNVVSNGTLVAFHPGYYVKQYLSSQGMKQSELADRLGTSEKTISNLVNGKIEKLSPELIRGLALSFGTSEILWKNLNERYLAKLDLIRKSQQLEEDKKVFKQMDYSFWVRHGWVKQTSKIEEKIEELRRYLKVSSLTVLQNSNFLVQYKMAVTEVQEKNVINANAWIQTAINMANSTVTKPVNLKYLRSKLDCIRKMTLEAPEDFLPKLRNIFEESGIAFVMVPNLKNCGINGAVKWLGEDKVLLALSDRRKYSDVFWFALFHEIRHVFQKKKAHIIVSVDKDIEVNSKINIENLEADADKFAQNFLIKPKDYAEFIKSKDFSRAAVEKFAEDIKIQPGIVVGRLQRDGYIDFSHLNSLKQRYEIIIS